MPSYLWFIIVVVIVVLAVTAYKIPPAQWLEYFKTKTGLGVLKGIVLAVTFGALLALAPQLLAAERGIFFKDASVYLGLDQTRKLSPQCVRGGVDDRWTSNLGVRIGLYESDDQRFKTNLKYTHHSCMLGEDADGYDAIGIEMEYRFWIR